MKFQMNNLIMLALLVPVQGLAPSFDPPYHPKDGTQNPFCGGGAGAELVLDFAAAAEEEGVNCTPAPPPSRVPLGDC